MSTVLLLHCYPSELKQGSEELIELISRHGVRLVDMGHTHYNEIANTGETIFTATRSTGQIEEGPASFSVNNLNGEATSWRFSEPCQLPFVMITSPADHRLRLDSAQQSGESKNICIRAKVWSTTCIVRVEMLLASHRQEMQRIEQSQVWHATLQPKASTPGSTQSRSRQPTNRGIVAKITFWRPSP